VTSLLSREDVLAGLRGHGFHQADASPRYHAQTWAHGNILINVKRTDSNPLVLHPAIEPSLPILEALPGVIRGQRPYCHNSQYVPFPKRFNNGRAAIHYGIDFGFESVAAFDALIHFVLKQFGSAELTGPTEFDAEARIFYEQFIDEENPQFLYWLPNYRNTLQVIRGALSRDASDEIFEMVWKSRDNSVSNAGRGRMGHAEADRNRGLLCQLLQDIAADGSPASYAAAIEKFEQWRDLGHFANVYRLLVARAFAALHPQRYHTTVDAQKQEEIIPWFVAHTGFVAPSGDWAVRAEALSSHLDRSGMFPEIELRNMFPWFVFEQMRNSAGKVPFRSGHTPKPPGGQVRGSARESEIEYRHNLIQDRLFQLLSAQHGKDFVGTEHATGTGGRADALVKRPDGRYDLYEIKPAWTAASAVRQAIGQLLEYAYRENGLEPVRLIVVSDATLDVATDKYLKRLHSAFSIDIEYMHIEVKVDAESDLLEDA
jgi:hypothetical protein